MKVKKRKKHTSEGQRGERERERRPVTTIRLSIPLSQKDK